MQTVSALYNSIMTDPAHWYETKLVIDGVGTFDETQLFSIETSVQMLQDTPTIGKAAAQEIEIQMLMPSATIPAIATLRPYVRAHGMAARSSAVTITGDNLASEYASYSAENITFSAEAEVSVSGENISFPVTSYEEAVSEWIPQGVYFIDTREVTANQNGLDVLTIHGFDAMLKAEQDYASNAAVGDDLDTAYVLAIAEQMGVGVDPRTWDIMGAGHIITFPLGYSCREILGYIAGIYIGSFVMTDEGKLRLISLLTLPPETNLLIDDVGDVLVFGNDSILI